MNDAMGIKIYGPQGWARIKRAHGVQQLGAWYDSILSIGKGALSIYSGSQQTAAYKELAEQQAKERQQILTTLVKWGTVAAVLALAYKVVKA